MVPGGFFIATEQKDTIYQVIIFFKYVDGNMRRWVQELGNLCCRPQMLSYNFHSCEIDGHNGLLRQEILKRFLAASHKSIRSDTEVGKEPLLKGLRTTKGNLTLDL